MRAIATKWTEHIKDPEKKKEFEKLLRHSNLSLGRLKEIAEDLLASLNRIEVKSEVYDNPNWAYKQADTNGMRRAYANIIQLLSFLDREDK